MSVLSWRIFSLSIPVQGPSVDFLRRLAVLSTLLLVFVLSRTAAELTWRLLPEPESRAAPPPVVVAGLVTAKDSNINAIVQSHLFGRVDVAAPQPQAPIPTAVPETPLKLVLRGIIMSIPPRGGAIIAEVGGEDHFYRRGDALPSGAVLQEIQQKQVFLLRDHRLEVLRLPNANVPSEGAEGASNGAVGSHQSLGQVREQILANPISFLKLVQSEPVYHDGRLEGFRVRPGQDDAGFLRRIGLESGDLVTRLNGIALDDPMKIPSLLQQLRDLPTLNVDVLRQGRTESIVLRFAR